MAASSARGSRPCVGPTGAVPPVESGNCSVLGETAHPMFQNNHKDKGDFRERARDCRVKMGEPADEKYQMDA